MTLTLYFILAKQSFKEFTTYRGTSILVALFGFILTLIEVLAGNVYYTLSDTIGGLTYNQYLVMIMGLACVTSTYQFLFVGAHENLANDIISGNLDYTFLKPINSYFYYALRKLDFPSLINLIIYLPVTISLINKFSLNFGQWLILIAFYLVGVLFVFSLNQLVVEVAFFKDNLTALNGVPEYLIDSANRPQGIFPGGLRLILLYLVPVLSLSNGIIYLVMTQDKIQLGIQMFLALTVFTTLLFLGSYLLWQKGIKKYVSTN
ncbi:ABC-2 family transporter protein [Holzapfeliella sp. He02]|uniref:ABC-2 family transporter protein n=1 Tax=Holzapfeliella saturejae TaxID=3082953 RepID=A0ABU8SIM7_9LACO